jgi:hypothetical protein
MDQYERYLEFKKDVIQSTLKVIERFQQQGKTNSGKSTSNIDVVRNVLKKAGHPLHVTDIIQMAQLHHQVQLNRDSIVSAILKKINAGETFIKTAPNTFALKTYTDE